MHKRARDQRRVARHRIDVGAGHAEVDERYQPGQIRPLVLVQPDLRKPQRHGQRGPYGPAKHGTGVGMQTRREINGHNRAAWFIDAVDGLAVASRDFGGQPRS